MLLELPYFDVVRMCTIDPRHNLLLIKDYGPVHSFWGFALERMNGILGSYPVNHHISYSKVVRQQNVCSSQLA